MSLAHYVYLETPTKTYKERLERHLVFSRDATTKIGDVKNIQILRARERSPIRSRNVSKKQKRLWNL